VYPRWVGVFSYVDALADGLRLRDLALAGITLATLLGLVLWCAYRKPRPGRPGNAGSAAPDHPPEVICPEMKSGDPAKVAFNVRLLVEQGARPLTQHARDKGLRLTTAVAEDVPCWARGDPSRLRNVLLSLLDNAIKFTNEGAVRLEVVSTAEAGGRAQLRFDVYDTGAGIDAETLDRLLEPNASAEHSAGHGLPMSVRMVARMGGTMGAESEPRGGSTFWFTVPVEIVEPASDVRSKACPDLAALACATVSTSETPLLLKASSPGKRVLIVEHDPAQQVATLWGLRALGYSGEVVSTSDAALEAWDRTPFDLVLLDCAMADAGETTKGIRRLETGCIPIVAMSATVDEQPIRRAGAVDDHLAKPVCLVELARVLHHWLDDAAPAYTSEATSAKLSLPV